MSGMLFKHRTIRTDTFFNHLVKTSVCCGKHLGTWRTIKEKTDLNLQGKKKRFILFEQTFKMPE
jgi:hypothetical protein